MFPRALSRLQLVGAALVVLACNGGKDDEPTTTKPAASPESPAAVGPAAPAPAADTDIQAAAPATDVTGAFVAGCSNDTRTSFLKDDKRGVDVSACVVLDETGKLVEARDLRLRALIRGAWIEPPVLGKEVESVPWQIGVSLPIRDAVVVESWEVSFADTTGAVRAATTSSAAFPWLSNAIFAQVAETLRSLYSFLESPAEGFGVADDGALKRQIAAGDPVQVAFLTAAGVKGDVGLAGADALCAAEGAALLPGKTWRAVLSTSAVDAKEHAKVTAVVYNYEGRIVMYPDSTWKQPKIAGGIKYTSKGESFRVSLEGTPEFDYTPFVWTGTTAEGLYDPDGSCSDWTSAAPDQIGRSGDGPAHEVFAEKIFWPCSRFARLICLSME